MNRITMIRSGKDGPAHRSKVSGKALRLSAVGALTAVVALAGLPAAATHPSRYDTTRHDTTRQATTHRVLQGPLGR